MKKCNRCLIEKSFNEFFRDRVGAGGYYSICKECKTNSTLQWRKKNKKTYNAKMREYREKNKTYFRNAHLKKNYGISQEEYEAMLTAQGRRCAICDKRNGRGKRPFVVDHDHDTNKVRGVLCYGCNRGLNMIEKRLEKALAYLKKFK